MVIDKFKEYVLQSSLTFQCIHDSITNPNKEKGISLLRLFNNIVDSYLIQSSTEAHIIMPIIHFPECEIWAKDLCIEFLILKLAFTKNSKKHDSLDSMLERPILLPEGKNCRKTIEVRKNLRTIKNNFSNCEYYGNDIPDMIVCSDINKLPSIYKELVAIDTNKYSPNEPTINTKLNGFDLEKKLKKSRYIFENLFLFHSSTRGVSQSYSENQILRLNQYNLGVKHCFIFSFSIAPYCLYHIKESFKNRLCADYTNSIIVKYSDFDSFITFTKNEMDYVFRRHYNKSGVLIVEQNNEVFWKETMALYLEGRPSNIRERNICSLCINSELQKTIENHLSEEIDDFEPNMCSDFFSMIIYIWDTNIIPRVLAYVGNQPSFAFICEWNLPDDIQQTLIDIFKKKYNKKLILYAWSDLKAKKYITYYKTMISEPKIVIMRYRSPNGFFHPYPNSFDSICLSKGQSALEIINNLIFQDLISFDKAKYKVVQNEVIYSKFRIENLGWKNVENASISHQVSIQTFDGDDYVCDKNINGPIEKFEIIFVDDLVKRGLSSSDLVIIRTDGQLAIKELRHFELYKNIQELQLLEDFFEPINTLIEQKLKKDNVAERAIRRNPKYDLSEEEIESQTEMWKLLLNHKIKKSSVECIYKEINPSISLNTFNSWFDIDNSMILPRSGNDQKALLAHLDLWTPNIYFKILSMKKRAQIKESKEFNLQIERLLCSILICDINERDFDEIRNDNSEILEMLSVEQFADLQALKIILRDYINIKPLKSIRSYK